MLNRHLQAHEEVSLPLPRSARRGLWGQGADYPVHMDPSSFFQTLEDTGSP